MGILGIIFLAITRRFVTFMVAVYFLAILVFGLGFMLFSGLGGLAATLRWELVGVKGGRHRASKSTGPKRDRLGHRHQP